MKRLIVTCALSLLLAACASEPPPQEPSYRERAAANRRTAREVEPAPQGLLAPVDRWRERLAERLPSPWTLAVVDAQVQAPPGWTRVAGDRGLVLWFDDGTQRQPFWLLPRDFDGRIHDPSIAAEIRAQDDQFVLFGPRADAPGWSSTPSVVDALEIH